MPSMVRCPLHCRWSPSNMVNIWLSERTEPRIARDGTYFSSTLDVLGVARDEAGLVWCGRHDVDSGRCLLLGDYILI